MFAPWGSAYGFRSGGGYRPLICADCAESDGYLSITTAGRGKVTFVHFRRIFVNFYRTFGLFVLAGCRRRHSVATISNLQQDTYLYRIALLDVVFQRRFYVSL